MSQETKDKILFILAIIFVILVVGISIWWSVAQWKECKRMELSNFYCIEHIF
jgi:hypothetical protein